MDHFSYQNPERQSMALPSGAEAIVSLRSDDEILMSSREKSTKSTIIGRLNIPMMVALMLWVMLITVELSPFALIIRGGNDPHAAGAGKGSVVSQEDDDDEYSVKGLWGSTASLSDLVFGIRPCSLEECVSSPCEDPESTRFACLSLQHDKQARGGCGAVPWTKTICADQCDASGCSWLLREKIDASQLQQPGSDENVVEDCDTECPKHWCERNRLCGAEAAPYQCTTGLSIYGCSADMYEWTVRSTDTDCSACCNTNFCT